ncbi:MAG: hypothetical protein FWG87_12265 [Defluviitaleaceae bacterium]|nr:hypothetical protein [Defluviitaleaceae bacterium]
MHITRPELTNVKTSGRINPSPTIDRHNNRTNDKHTNDKHTNDKHTNSKINTISVEDGFIRPEVTSFCVNARYPHRIDERAYLGTDKSVPYKNLQFSSGLTNDLCNTDLTDLTDLHGLRGLARGKIHENPLSPKESAQICVNPLNPRLIHIFLYCLNKDIERSLRRQNPRKSAKSAKIRVPCL